MHGYNCRAGYFYTPCYSSTHCTLHSRVFRPQLWLVSSSVHGEHRSAGTPDVRILQRRTGASCAIASSIQRRQASSVPSEHEPVHFLLQDSLLRLTFPFV